jgi:peroxiredoxin
MRRSAGADFTFLSDPEGRLLDLLDVRHAGGRADGADIAQSATFLLAPDGEVLWSRLAVNYRQRPKPGEVLEAVDRHVGGAPAG